MAPPLEPYLALRSAGNFPPPTTGRRLRTKRHAGPTARCRSPLARPTLARGVSWARKRETVPSPSTPTCSLAFQWHHDLTNGVLVEDLTLQRALHERQCGALSCNRARWAGWPTGRLRQLGFDHFRCSKDGKLVQPTCICTSVSVHLLLELRASASTCICFYVHLLLRASLLKTPMPMPTSTPTPG
jgi:hypothetical protein